MIAQLQLLDKDIPFDAEVVTGDDWQPSELVRVFHEPPYTFLEFKSIDGYGVSEESKSFNDAQLTLVHAYLSSVLHNTQSKELSLSDAANEILGFVTFCQSHSPAAVIERLKALSSEASG